MANIEDYLDWRGDIPFSFDRFNAIDNLVLSQMSYIDFEGVVPTTEEAGEISVKDACRKYFELHSDEELAARKTLISKIPPILKKIAASERFGNMKLYNYCNLVSDAADVQMSAISCDLDDGSTFIAYRGTDDTLAGWKEDFNLSYSPETPGQKLAVEYLNRKQLLRQRPLRLGGHSKGGNFAMYAAAFCNVNIRERIGKVYSNDGPGFIDEVINTGEYQQMLPKVRKIMPESSVIGMIMETGARQILVKSSASGVMQHDALTWQALGNRFVEAEELSQSSRFFDRTMQNWLAGISAEERKSFIDSFFSILGADGKETLSEVGKNKGDSLLEGFKVLKSLPPEKQKEFFDVIGKLMKSNKESFSAEWTDMGNNPVVSLLKGFGEKYLGLKN